ncbi:cyclin-dependent kinase 20 isoform 2-T2 [Cariama cristata]
MDQYIVLGRIGEGAHGVVFKAKDRETGETVALKKVPLRRPEEGVPPQTLREIKALREIEDHPHVVRLRAAFAQGPAVVLAFDFLVGDLGGLLRATPAPLSPPRIRALMAMTLRGLGHCHRQRILHRVVPSPRTPLRRPALRRGGRFVGGGVHFWGALEFVPPFSRGERHRATVLRAEGVGDPQSQCLAGAVGASRLPQDPLPTPGPGPPGAAGARGRPRRPRPFASFPPLPLAPAPPRPPETLNLRPKMPILGPKRRRWGSERMRKLRVGPKTAGFEPKAEVRVAAAVLGGKIVTSRPEKSLFGLKSPSFGVEPPQPGTETGSLGAENPQFGAKNVNLGSKIPNFGVKTPILS